MKPLSTHRQNFSWARNEYNKTDDLDTQTKYTQFMAKYLAEGKADGFTVEQITQGNSYPAQVDRLSSGIDLQTLPSINEEQVKKQIEEAVDSAAVVRIGEGGAAVYAYGYACCPDRLKVGYATGDVLQRIADQIFTSTPDKPVLHLEIRTDNCRALERAIHAVLELRGRKTKGGGDEWFKITRDEVVEIYKFVTAPTP
jgi:hypothetical protein